MPMMHSSIGLCPHAEVDLEFLWYHGSSSELSQHYGYPSVMFFPLKVGYRVASSCITPQSAKWHHVEGEG